MCVLSLLFFAACSQPAPQPAPQPEQPAQPEQPQAQPETPAAQPNPVASPEVQEIQQIMRSGDFREAITRAEALYADDPTESVSNLLIQAHGNYAIKVSEMPDIDEAEANLVLYMHLMRVNELDPENREAMQGLDQVRAWFDNNNMPLPETVDPLTFLGIPEEPAEEPTDEPAGE